MPSLAKRLVSPEALAGTGLVVPDHWSGPDWVLTDGPAVADICAAANFAPDPQQQLALDLLFAVGADGLPACFSEALISCRQNLKTGTLKQAAIGWVYVTDEQTVVWSAHEMGTTLDAQRELHELLTSTPALSKLLPAQRNQGSYNDNGSERIEFTTGQRIKFKARTATGGRGLSGDKVILDEAFALKPSHTASLLPTMLARKGRGQVVYASSAGMADSVVLRDVRDRGRTGATARLGYLEWGGVWRACRDPECAHPKNAAELGLGCSADDPDLLRANNPTVSTGRITLQTLADLRQELMPADFIRECMGRWDEADQGAETAFGAGMWSACATDRDRPEPYVLGLAVSIDRAWSSLAAASRPTDLAPGHLGAVLRSRGTTVVLEETVRIALARNIRVAVDGRSPAGALIPALEARGVKVLVAGTEDYVTACAELYDAVQLGPLPGGVEHGDDDDLNEAAAVATTRPVGERWAWSRKAGDVSMLEAATLARWGAGVHAPSVYEERDLVVLGGAI